MAYAAAGLFAGLGLGSTLRTISIYWVIIAAALVLALTIWLAVMAYRGDGEDERE